ncbi:Vacuolar protein sorting-associated protein [Globisporangium polare]
MSTFAAVTSHTGSAESLSNGNSSSSSNHSNGVNLEEIDFDELDDYLELFQQDGIIKEALSKGVDLRQYAQQIDQELRAAEIDSVSQYVMKSEDIVELHDQVQECDNILAKMQEMLLGFQADLGGISDEIRHLQDESIGMNVRLKNRRETEDQLKRYLDQVALAPSLVATIDGAEVNDAFLHALVALNGKLKYAALREPDPTGSSFDLVPSQTAAFREVEAQLQKLKARAVARVREFLLSKMNEVKKPKTNVQMVQQNTLLPMKYLVTFLADNAADVEEEFREVYAEAMSKTLTTVFKSYHTGLMKFYEEVATRTDLIAIEEQSLKGIFSSRVNLTKRNDTFSMGDREKILEAPAASPLILHVAQQENHKLPYEAIFRNVQQHLMNSATSEYLFLIDFFKPSFGDNPMRSRDLFLRVFAKTLSSCLENLENYLFTCYDAVGLLLMIRITYAQRLVMEKRRIPVLDSYFDRVTLLLWPRFKAVFDLNLLSVKNAKVKKLGAIDLHPHYVIRRYAEFAASVLSLSMYTQPQSQQQQGDDATIHSAQMHENGAGDMVLNNLAVLRDEILGLLTRLAEQHRNSKDRCVFLVNNYDLVLSLFQERRIISEETAKLEELLAEQRERFVEEELMTWYAKLIQFVRHNESLTLNKSVNKDTNAAAHEVDTAAIEKIVREFASTWKSGIEKMNGNIMKFFSNFRNGMEILKQVLTQLLLYYTRFIEIVKKSYQRPPPFGNDIVTTQEILYEIKKYSRSF